MERKNSHEREGNYVRLGSQDLGGDPLPDTGRPRSGSGPWHHSRTSSFGDEIFGRPPSGTVFEDGRLLKSALALSNGRIVSFKRHSKSVSFDGKLITHQFHPNEPSISSHKFTTTSVDVRAGITLPPRVSRFKEELEDDKLQSPEIKSPQPSSPSRTKKAIRDFEAQVAGSAEVSPIDLRQETTKTNLIEGPSPGAALEPRSKTPVPFNRPPPSRYRLNNENKTPETPTKSFPEKYNKVPGTQPGKLELFNSGFKQPSYQHARSLSQPNHYQRPYSPFIPNMHQPGTQWDPSAPIPPALPRNDDVLAMRNCQDSTPSGYNSGASSLGSGSYGGVPLGNISPVRNNQVGQSAVQPQVTTPNHQRSLNWRRMDSPSANSQRPFITAVPPPSFGTPITPAMARRMTQENQMLGSPMNSPSIIRHRASMSHIPTTPSRLGNFNQQQQYGYPGQQQQQYGYNGHQQQYGYQGQFGNGINCGINGTPYHNNIAGRPVTQQMAGLSLSELFQPRGLTPDEEYVNAQRRTDALAAAGPYPHQQQHQRSSSIQPPPDYTMAGLHQEAQGSSQVNVVSTLADLQEQNRLLQAELQALKELHGLNGNLVVVAQPTPTTTTTANEGPAHGSVDGSRPASAQDIMGASTSDSNDNGVALTTIPQVQARVYTETGTQYDPLDIAPKGPRGPPKLEMKDAKVDGKVNEYISTLAMKYFEDGDYGSAVAMIRKNIETLSKPNFRDEPQTLTSEEQQWLSFSFKLAICLLHLGQETEARITLGGLMDIVAGAYGPKQDEKKAYIIVEGETWKLAAAVYRYLGFLHGKLQSTWNPAFSEAMAKNALVIYRKCYNEEVDFSEDYRNPEDGTKSKKKNRHRRKKTSSVAGTGEGSGWDEAERENERYKLREARKKSLQCEDELKASYRLVASILVRQGNKERAEGYLDNLKKEFGFEVNGELKSSVELEFEDVKCPGDLKL